MLDATIEVNGLRKRFGPTVALDGMTFTVQPGQVTGFVGPNGAGKSTTMRVILGLDAADEGSALVGGRPYQTLHQPLTRVGSLLDAAALQLSRSARNHLLWLAHSQGLNTSRVDAVIEQAGLHSAARRKAGGSQAAAGTRPRTSHSVPTCRRRTPNPRPRILGREDVGSASGPASVVLRWCGRKVGNLGPGLTSESADAARAVLRNDLSAGSQFFWHPPAVPV